MGPPRSETRFKDGPLQASTRTSALSFDAPSLHSGGTPSNAPASQGGLLLFSFSGGLAGGYSAAGRAGGTACGGSVWVSASALLCHAGSGLATGMAAVATVACQVPPHPTTCARSVPKTTQPHAHITTPPQPHPNLQATNETLNPKPQPTNDTPNHLHIKAQIFMQVGTLTEAMSYDQLNLSSAQPHPNPHTTSETFCSEP